MGTKREVMAVDCGRYQVKVSTARRNWFFPSLIGEANTLRLGTQIQDYRLEVGGIEYFVGHLAEESPSRRFMATASKANEDTRAKVLCAVAAANVGGPVTVYTGVPINQYEDQQTMELAQLLTGTTKVKLNGEKRTVEIEKVECLPEGAGAFWGMVLDDEGKPVNPDLLKLDLVRVVDLGSRTIDVVTLVRGNYLNRASFSLDYGCFELEKGRADEFAKRIVGDIAKNIPELDLASDPIFLTGGGALRLTGQLEAVFGNLKVTPDPVMANAVGFRRLGMLRASH